VRVQTCKVMRSMITDEEAEIVGSGCWSPRSLTTCQRRSWLRCGWSQPLQARAEGEESRTKAVLPDILFAHPALRDPHQGILDSRRRGGGIACLVCWVGWTEDSVKSCHCLGWRIRNVSQHASVRIWGLCIVRRGRQSVLEWRSRRGEYADDGSPGNVSIGLRSCDNHGREGTLRHCRDVSTER
jgi:hypothetical protein